MQPYCGFVPLPQYPSAVQRTPSPCPVCNCALESNTTTMLGHVLRRRERRTRSSLRLPRCGRGITPCTAFEPLACLMIYALMTVVLYDIYATLTQLGTLQRHMSCGGTKAY